VSARETHPDWDGDFEDYARCPHCGEADEETCEYPRGLQRDGDSSETDCGFCGEPFKVTMCVSYSFATEPLFIGPKRDAGHWFELRCELRAGGHTCLWNDGATCAVCVEATR
jgi:hypothetical protein